MIPKPVRHELAQVPDQREIASEPVLETRYSLVSHAILGRYSSGKINTPNEARTGGGDGYGEYDQGGPQGLQQGRGQGQRHAG